MSMVRDVNNFFHQMTDEPVDSKKDLKNFVNLALKYGANSNGKIFFG